MIFYKEKGWVGYWDVMLRPKGGSVIRTLLGRRALLGYLGGFIKEKELGPPPPRIENP